VPQLDHSILIPWPPAEVFAFFLSPANLLALAPPDLHLQLVDGPERLELGSRVTWKARRWGIAQRIVVEVVALEPDAQLVEEQRQGPLRRWLHTRQFEAAADGTRLTERIEFEPPGGLLGLTVTAAAVERELQAAFAHRAAKLPELLRGAFGEPGASAP
jgi:ligand-binding SRPBCC domain-containing protein